MRTVAAALRMIAASTRPTRRRQLTSKSETEGSADGGIAAKKTRASESSTAAKGTGKPRREPPSTP